MAEAESNINSFELDLVSERTKLFDFDKKTLFTAKYEHKGSCVLGTSYIFFLFSERHCIMSCVRCDVVLKLKTLLDFSCLRRG